MRLYDEFLDRKNNGESLKLTELSSENLRIMFIDEKLTDGMIAEIFDVKPSKITNLRKKYVITIRNSILEDFMDGISQENQMKLKEELFNDDITRVAKAITHFAFRNGPIEGMHADESKNITDQDMKVLNKHMVNRLAYVFNLIKDDRWFEINFMVNKVDEMFGQSWDDAEPDDGGMRELLLKELDSHRE